MSKGKVKKEEKKKEEEVVEEKKEEKPFTFWDIIVRKSSSITSSWT